MRLLDAKFLQEDNKAMSDFKLLRVMKGSEKGIIEYVSRISGVPVKDLHPVGSTGKAESAGDLDLAIDENKHQPFLVHDRMTRSLTSSFATYNKGTRVGSYAVPVGEDFRVQVDLMFTNNIEWAKFAYFSAGDKSEYKGAVRAVLLAAVAAALDETGVDTFHYDGEELIVRVGRGIDLGVGMKRLFQMRPHKKYGEGYVKGLKKVTPEEIKKMYPDLEFDGTDLIIDDPLEVVKILFGPSTRPSNVDSVEEVLDLIQRFPSGKQRKILNIAKIRAKQLAAKGIKLPAELS